MSLEESIREQVLTYCDRDLPSDDKVATMFDFISDTKVRARVESEFYAARYIYKLGEALDVSEDRLHAHVKFQIVQYASIYEVIIVNLLWEKFSDHPAVTNIEFHDVYRKYVSLPSTLQFSNSEGNEIYFCVKIKESKNRTSIKFDDKVDAAVNIGFIDEEIGEEIKSFYKLRNAIHIESAIKNDIKYEIDSSLLAFRRMLPFTRGVRGFLQNGVLPDNARIKKTMAGTEGL